MYGSSLSYTRLRSAYDDERFAPGYTWQTPWTPRISAVNGSIPSRAGDTMASSHHSSTPARRNRYTRSSTSVTQLLSDSCSSLLQKLTTRVRGPSATVERSVHRDITNQQKPLSNYPLGASKSSSNLTARYKQDDRSSANLAIRPQNKNEGTTNLRNHKEDTRYTTRTKNEETNNNTQPATSTRSRLEDKYTSVLEKLYGRKKDNERTIEPSVGRTLSKSATTSNIILSEKSYPYISTANMPREKTPYKEIKSIKPKQQYPEPPYAYLDRDAVYRIRHRSNHSELRPRRSSKPQRSGKSECSDRKAPANLKLCPVEMPQIDVRPQKTKTPTKIEDETTPTPNVPDPTSEREAKRKEIQSLIMKYSALDEVYNRPKTNYLRADSNSTADSSNSSKSNYTASSSKNNYSSILVNAYPNKPLGDYNSITKKHLEDNHVHTNALTTFKPLVADTTNPISIPNSSTSSNCPSSNSYKASSLSGYNSLSSSTNSLAPPYHGSVAANLAQKYHSRLTSAVSNRRCCV